MTDTSVRLEVEAGGFGSATLEMRTTGRERRADHERIDFDRVSLERFDADTVVGRLLLTRDSSVVWRPDRREVFTSPDSVLAGGGRLVLAPGADSSLRVGLPRGLLRGAERTASGPWARCRGPTARGRWSGRRAGAWSGTGPTDPSSGGVRPAGPRPSAARRRTRAGWLTP